MNNVKMKKDDLLVIIKQNRRSYIEDLRKAEAEFLSSTAAELERILRELNTKKLDAVHLNVHSPTDHTSEYDSVIRKLELTVLDEIELSDTDFTNFVENKWTFVRQLEAVRASYVHG